MALTGTEKQRRYVERHPERRAAYLASPHFKALAAAKTARYRLRHPEKITEYRESQNGKCKICGGTTSNRKWKDGRIQRLKLFVDHDHESGKIRGLLCSTCNRGIAFLKEDISVLEAAIKYLMESRQ